jgi:YhfC intramembrane metalloprotease
VQNIDPAFMIEPIVVIGFSVGTVLYWRWKESFTKYVLAFSLLAYGGAIAAKAAFQYLTAPGFLSISQGSLWLLGLYFGIQTMTFEVGGAFLVARYAVSRRKMKKNDGVGYGLGLAFWENAILLSATSLLSLLFYSTAIAQGGATAESTYSLLSKSQPQLFYPAVQAIQVVGWGVLERISSFMVHVSWGYLCLLSAISHKKEYFLLALPMGLIDFLVPFARIMTISLFEIVVFMLAAFCVLTTIYATRNLAE